MMANQTLSLWVRVLEGAVGFLWFPVFISTNRKFNSFLSSFSAACGKNLNLARNLEAVDAGGTSDPYVLVSLSGNNSSTPLKGKVIKKTLIPVWNEEYFFPVVRAQQSLEIEVRDWNLVAFSESLGSVSIPLSGLKPGETSGQWHTLSRAKSGEVRVFVCLIQNAKLAQDIVPMRMPSFRMVLEKDVYFPGEMVRGVVYFNVNATREIRGIRLRCTGEGDAFWFYADIHSPGKADKITSLKTKVEYFDKRVTLWGNSRSLRDSKLDILVGAYAWPFEFVLAPNLPPSFRKTNVAIDDPDVCIQYWVHANVDIPRAKDKEVKCSFKLVSHYPRLVKQIAAPTETATQPPAPDASWPKKEINVLMKCTLPEFVLLDQEFTINLNVKNKSIHTIESITVQAYQTTRYCSVHEVPIFHSLDAAAKYHGFKSHTTTISKGPVTKSVKIYPSDEKPIQIPVTISSSAEEPSCGVFLDSIPPNFSALVQIIHTLKITPKYKDVEDPYVDAQIICPLIIGKEPPADQHLEFASDSAKEEEYFEIKVPTSAPALSDELVAVASRPGVPDGTVMCQRIPSSVFATLTTPTL